MILKNSKRLPEFRFFLCMPLSCEPFSLIFQFQLVFIVFYSTWVSPDLKVYNKEVKVKLRVKNCKYGNAANHNYNMKSKNRLLATWSM